MNDEALFDATVPVFRHYLSNTRRLLNSMPEGAHGMLEQKLAPHAFTAADHLDTAIGFISRTVHPLIGEQVQETVSDSTHHCLTQLTQDTAQWLERLSPKDFIGASDRVVIHSAGDASLEQEATAFVTLFALPNFFFHLSNGFAILRHEGLAIGKRDFDGLHEYAAGFHF